MSAAAFAYPADPDTNWEAVVALRDPARQRGALGILLRDYERVIRGRVERSVGEAGAEDAFQDFAAWVIAGERFAEADRGRGQFRCFLSTMLTRWLVNRHRDGQAERRGGQSVHVEVQEEVLPGEAEGEEWFDREWALELLRRAVARAAAGNGVGAQAAGEVLLAALTGRSEKARETLLAALRWELRVVCRDGFVEEELAYLMRVLGAAVARGWDEKSGAAGSGEGA